MPSGSTGWMQRSLMALPSQTLPIVLVVLCSFLGLTAAIDVKECFDGSESDAPGNVTLSCPERYVITIEEAFFVRNKWGACVLVDGDCIDKTKIFQNCEGMNNCTRTFKTYSPLCGYSTMMRLIYSCTLPSVSLVVTSSTPSTVSGTTLATTTLGVQNLVQPNHGRTTETLRLEKDNRADMEEIGLIVGCVIASVVTVIALIIAIIMVIRRLCQSSDKEKTEDSDGSAQSKSCVICICLDCNKTGSEEEETTRKQPAASFNSSHRTNQNTRMAPVGQESSSSNESLELEMEGIAEAPYANGSTQQHAGQNQNQNASCQNTDFLPSSHSDLCRDQHPVHTNKASSCVKNIDNQPGADASNNNEEKTVHQEKDNSKHVATSLSHMDHTGEKQKSSDNTARQTKDYQRRRNHRPKFDAVAIPNTELGTQC